MKSKGTIIGKLCLAILLFLLTTGIPSADQNQSKIAYPFAETQEPSQISRVGSASGETMSWSKAVGDPVNMDAALIAGADYLRHAQADVTEDNAGNGDPDVDPEDGGWDWRLTSPNFTHSASSSPTNIYGATAQGLYYAYLETADTTYMTAMQDAATYMIGNANIRSAADLTFLMRFQDLPGVTPSIYSDAAKAKFDARITTYGTATALAEYIRDTRQGQGYENGIIPWDIGAWVVAAQMLEDNYPSDPYDYAQAADDMAEVIYQDSYEQNPGYFDLTTNKNNGWDPAYGNPDYWWYTLGITGLLDAFYAADVHTDKIPGLLTILLNCQYAGGAFSYCYGANTDDEDWQSTAYSVLSLSRVDQPTYQANINHACYWLGATQDVGSGGWVYSSGNHYPEIGGECSAALYFGQNATEVWVDDDYTEGGYNDGHIWGYDAFDNIQDGVDGVGGSIVNVAAGTYTENVVVAKSLDLLGADSSTTIIDGSNVGNTVTITASDVTLSGFTVTGGWANGLDVFHPVGGVVVEGNSGDTSLTGITIEDNIIDANPGNGVYVSAAGHGGGTDNVVIQNCRISNNGGANAGISLTYPNYIVRPVGVWDEWKRPKNILVQGNIIYGNSSYGVYVSAGQYNVIRSNIIRDNSKYGLQLASSWNRTDIPGEYTTVDSNYIYDNTRNGVKLTSYNQYNTFTGNAIYNNGFGGTSEYYQYGILFQDGNDNAISDNTITGNALGGLYLWGKGDPSYTWYSTTDNTITGNIISDHTTVDAKGIYIPAQYGNPNSGFLNSSINGNRITNNSAYGLENADATQIVDASGNWWGAYCGPHHPTTNPNGQGDEVSDYVDYEPWCDSTLTECDFSTTPPSMVWVDDGYTPLGDNDGHYWCYDAFDKIQDGVDVVAAGGTVNVAAGTYEEQIRIDGKGVELVGTGVGQSIIEAVPVVDRVTYTVTQWTGSPRTVDACIGVTDAGIVNISGFTVDGKELGPDNFYGIHYFNTSGSVINCRIEDITDAAHPSNSRVVSLLATHGDGETIAVDLSNNVIPNFQKCGIVVMGPGATFTVNGNSVSGVVSSSIAGNCIQLSYGATGSTASNYVEGTAYTGSDWASSGILFFECGDISMVGDSAYNCENGVNFSDWGWIYNHPVPVNLGFANLVLDNNEWSLGIQLSRDNSDVNMTVTGCDISNSTGDGIDFYCTGAGSYYTGWDNGDLNATVTGSNITGSALDGIWGADYSGNANNVSISVNYCMFSGNVGSAINNDFTQMMDATACYWGDPMGPTIGVKSGATRQVAPAPSPYGDDLLHEGIVVMTEASNALKGTGETIYGPVDYSPWWGENYVGDPHTDAWTWYVNASNSSTIQEGIDAASSLDTLRVRPDTYEENAVIDKSLALLGAGRDSVLVYPATSDIGMPNPEEGPSFRGSQIFVVEAADVTIEGFTLDGDSPTLTPEGTIDARNGIITNYNTGDWSDLKVRQCTAKNIYLRAIYASAQTPNNLTGVDFSNNSVSNVKGSSMQSAGIMLWGSSGDAKYNQVSDASLGIFYHWNSDGSMDSNTVTTSELGLGVNSNDSPTSISHNTITDCDQGIQTISTDSPVTVELNQITACTSGVVLYGGGGGETNVWENKIEGLGTYGTMGVYASTDLSPWGVGDLSANLKRNTVTDNFYGMVLNEPPGDLSQNLSVLIGGASADYNLIYDNLNYELLMEYCNDDQTATHNYWGYSLYTDIEEEIFHQVDQASFGLVTFKPAILHGDVNLDGIVDLGDVIYLINYLYKNGPDPEVFIVADVNRDGEIDLADVIYLINYLYKSGPPPFAAPATWAEPITAKPMLETDEKVRPADVHSPDK